MPTPLTGTAKRVRVHWFRTAFAIRMNNISPNGDTYWRQQWTVAGGQGATYDYCGCWARTTPLVEDLVYTSTDATATWTKMKVAANGVTTNTWRINDGMKDVANMRQAGINGVYVEMSPPTMTAPGLVSGGHDDWNRGVWAFESIDEYNRINGTSFDAVPQMDMSGGGNNTPVSDMVNGLKTFWNYACTYKVVDGGVTKMVVSPFSPEAYIAMDDVAFWRDNVMPQMAAAGMPIILLPCFNSYGPNWQAYLPISIGFSHWGSRNPAQISDGSTESTHPGVTRGQNAHNNGVWWIQPVCIQDERPRSRVADEAVGWGALEKSWLVAINAPSDGTLLPTWEDASECSCFMPSSTMGRATVRLNAKWAYRYTNGSFPQNDDSMFLAHRVHPYGAVPSYAGYDTGSGKTPNMMSLRSGSTAFGDYIDLVTFFKAPTQVTFTIGNRTTAAQTIPAGYYRTQQTWSTADMTSGSMTVTVNATRNGVTQQLYIPDRSISSSSTTPKTLTATPQLQDLAYWANDKTATFADNPVTPPPGGTNMTAQIGPLQLRRGTAAAWTSANTVLLAGQEGLETDTGRRKTGDGATTWNNLAYDDELTLRRMYDRLGGLANGEATLFRDDAITLSVALSSGIQYYHGFRAWKTEAINYVTTYVGAAGATLSVARIGIYSVDEASGAITGLLASTANDATMWTGTTFYKKQLTSTFNKVAGTLYAVGVLAIGTTAPSLSGVTMGPGRATASLPFYTGLSASGQTDLESTGFPLTRISTTATNSNKRFYVEMTNA